MFEFTKMDYPPTEHLYSGVEVPETEEELRHWLESKKETQTKLSNVTDEELAGRFYITESIRYNPGVGLCQTGSAPCFFGGVWTLATCKKSMRDSNKFKNMFTEPEDSVRYPRRPVVVVGFSSRSKDYPKPKNADTRRNWLAHIGVVTVGFDSMETFHDHLMDNYSGEAVRHRQTHSTNRSELAADRGDLHTNDEGEVVYPPPTHQHGRNQTDADRSTCGCTSTQGSDSIDPYEHVDNKLDHIKCLSEPGMWIAWDEPQFALKEEEEFCQGHPKFKGIEGLLGRLEEIDL